MITVRELVHQGELVGFIISGHSGFGEDGNDIVCAAVSALSDTTVLALEHLVGAAPQFSQQDGLLSCRVASDLEAGRREKARLVLDTMFLGIRNIADQYPVLFTLEKEEV